MCKLLYSSKNLEGVYLEDIIDSINNDLNTKLIAESHLPEEVKLNYMETNSEIISLLEEVKQLSISAIKFANKHSNLKPYVISGTEVLATELSYTEFYRGDVAPVDYGEDFEELGYYIVVNKGKVNHSEWWLPRKLFLEYTKK